VLKAGLFASRKTIVIDRDGLVAFIDDKVSPKTAGEDLVTILADLGA
jgi:peroxiredoxin